MANEYGRGGVASGGKGGQQLSRAYEFGAKSAGEYLSGGLASEYTQAASTLRTNLAPVGQRTAQGRIRARDKANESIGKLRGIAESNAVGEFLGFAGSMGRGSQAQASQGLVTGETFAPDAASTEKFTQASKNAGTGARKQAAIGTLTTPIAYGGSGGPVNYAEAAMGSTGAMYRGFQAQDSALAAERSSGSASNRRQRLLNMTPAERYFQGINV